MKRQMIERICLRCKNAEMVRKDGAGKHCRTCRAAINQENRKPKDITNLRYGKITVISFSHIDSVAYWNCLCDCGNKCTLAGSRLRCGQTKSCGCLQKSRKGLSSCSTFHIWKGMLQRCYDKSVKHYARYGGKGIFVCDRWKNSFENFLKDMGERPDNLTLDRIDSSKGYSPENCRWASYKEQANNKKSGYFITAFGQTLRLTEWAKKTGIGWSTIRQRIERSKWTSENALSKKVNNG